MINSIGERMKNLVTIIGYIKGDNFTGQISYNDSEYQSIHIGGVEKSVWSSSLLHEIFDNEQIDVYGTICRIMLICDKKVDVCNFPVKSEMAFEWEDVIAAVKSIGKFPSNWEFPEIEFSEDVLVSLPHNDEMQAGVGKGYIYSNSPITKPEHPVPWGNVKIEHIAVVRNNNSENNASKLAEPKRITPIPSDASDSYARIKELANTPRDQW